MVILRKERYFGNCMRFFPQRGTNDLRKEITWTNETFFVLTETKLFDSLTESVTFTKI